MGRHPNPLSSLKIINEKKIRVKARKKVGKILRENLREEFKMGRFRSLRYPR